MLKQQVFKHTLVASSVMTVLGLSASAWAQETDQSSVADDAKIEQITVTAQFRSQNLQETPLAITAISAKALEDRGQQSIDAISAQSPNVSLTTGGGFSGPSLIGFIRGVGQIDFNPAVEPGVGLYVDDVYYSQLSGSVLDLLDLERVEVLRGPQGTLAGKNSIGGAIKLYSKRPDEYSEGYVEVGLGSFDAVSVRGASEFTLVEDTLFARVSGVSRSREGHVSRLDYNCANPDNKVPGLPSFVKGPDCKIGSEGGIDYTAARVALRWLASDDLEVNFSADWTDNDSEAPGIINIGSGATIAPVIAYGEIWPTVAIPPTLATDVGERYVSEKGAYYNYGTYIDPRTNQVTPDEQTVNAFGATLNVEWQLAEDLQLHAISGYREFQSSFGSDQDGTPMPVQQLYQSIDHEQKSQELRLNGKLDNWIEYTLGAFWFDSHTELDARINLGYVGFDFLHGPDPVDTTSSAIFANAIFHVNESLDITLGLRRSSDEKEYTFMRLNPDFSEIEPCLGPPGTPGNPANCLIASLNGLTPPAFEDKRTDVRGALSYRINNDAMLYYQYSTGFKGGGVNPRPFYDIQAVNFAPEELKTHEIGGKIDLLDDILRINLAYFQNDYKDIQLTLNDCTALFGPVFGVPCLANQNAGSADVTGWEVEIDYMPIDGLLIEASASTLDFEFTEVDPSTGLTGEESTPFTPDLTWSLSAQYALETSSGTFTSRVDTNYQDKVQTQAAKTPLGTIDSYTLVNASITWLSKDETWQARLEVKNLTDEYYFANITDPTTTLSGPAYATPGLPRTWNVSVKRSF